jgi:predicted nucleic acid-binding protein
MVRKKVYIETSVVSYLTARPSSDLVAAAWQRVTMDWWDSRREKFDLFASEVVIEEAGRGDEVAAARRMEALAGIPLLAITDEVVTLSEGLIRRGVLARQAIGDSLHIALAAVHGVDYLLTWNYRHIANAESKPLIRKVCLENGFGYPEICTPQELMGGN